MGMEGLEEEFLMRQAVFNANKVVYKDKMWKCMVVEVNCWHMYIH